MCSLGPCREPTRSVEANCFLIDFSLWPVHFPVLNARERPALMCWSCTTQKGWFREAMGCGCRLLSHGRGVMQPVIVRGALHHLQTKPKPYVNFYPDPRLFLWVQVYYCCSNSFFLMECLNFHYKKELLRLSYLDCLLDNWPDHQSKAPTPQPLEMWERHMFISSECLLWCCTGFIRLAKNHKEPTCMDTDDSCLLIDVS